ncbi:GTPase HflX [Oscillospiraceae bacterium OttesenSCG-928-G22]|nr:GTPase HflX [Oscillospiraceae bacterium OttesenSCG-928-G22]
MEKFGRKREEKERAVLVGLSADVFSEAEQCSDETLDELEELLRTAGGVCVGKVLQKRHSPDPATYIGEGKALEVKALAETEEADLVIVDNEITPSQMRNLSKLIEKPVLDRSGLILDIFAARAQTSEGRLQVELAQYRYVLSKLSGLGTSLSRLGGGIGTRGPGETKLETDRRHIRRHISNLKEEFEKIRRVRATQRKKRTKESVPVVALVGYTNAGKSTLVNRLTGADLPANDRLFDTLDPSTRKLKLNDGLTVLFSDTVGFIRKLPTHLVEAFRATLEELKFADLILHVVDVSKDDWPGDMRTTEEVMRSLGVETTPVLHVYNKIDLSDDAPKVDPESAAVSAKTGEGIPELLDKIEAVLFQTNRTVVLLLPYSEAKLLDELYQNAQVLRADYLDGGIAVTARGTRKALARALPYEAPEDGTDG